MRDLAALLSVGVACFVAIFAAWQQAEAAGPGDEKADPQTVETVAARETTGPLDRRFKAAFERLRAKHTATSDQLGIDPVQFIAALEMIAARSADVRASEAALTSTGLPTAMFIRVRKSLSRSFARDLDLSDRQSDLLAKLLVRQAVVLTGTPRASDFLRTGTDLSHRVGPSLAGILQRLATTSTIRARCSVPFVAGYATDDGRTIYIDALVPSVARLGGRRAPLHALLNAHERIEKALLDDFGLSYPHAHQIALRSEKLFAEAVGTRWKPYDAYWNRIADEIDARGPREVPADLDLTPYLTFTGTEDVDLVRAMRKTMVDPSLCGGAK